MGEKIINGIKKRTVFLLFAIGFVLLVFSCEQDRKQPRKLLKQRKESVQQINARESYGTSKSFGAEKKQKEIENYDDYAYIAGIFKRQEEGYNTKNIELIIKDEFFESTEERSERIRKLEKVHSYPIAFMIDYDVRDISIDGNQAKAIVKVISFTKHLTALNIEGVKEESLDVYYLTKDGGRWKIKGKDFLPEELEPTYTRTEKYDSAKTHEEEYETSQPSEMQEPGKKSSLKERTCWGSGPVVRIEVLDEKSQCPIKAAVVKLKGQEGDIKYYSGDTIDRPYESETDEDGKAFFSVNPCDLSGLNKITKLEIKHPLYYYFESVFPLGILMKHTSIVFDSVPDDVKEQFKFEYDQDKAQSFVIRTKTDSQREFWEKVKNEDFYFQQPGNYTLIPIKVEMEKIPEEIEVK